LVKDYNATVLLDQQLNERFFGSDSRRRTAPTRCQHRSDPHTEPRTGSKTHAHTVYILGNGHCLGTTITGKSQQKLLCFGVTAAECHLGA